MKRRRTMRRIAARVVVFRDRIAVSLAHDADTLTDGAQSIAIAVRSKRFAAGAFS